MTNGDNLLRTTTTESVPVTTTKSQTLDNNKEQEGDVPLSLRLQSSSLSSHSGYSLSSSSSSSSLASLKASSLVEEEQDDDEEEDVQNGPTVGFATTKDIQDEQEEVEASSTTKEEASTQSIKKAMALNDAFLALESMRKANLEIEFGRLAANTHCCIECLQEFCPNKEESRRQRWSQQRICKKKSPPCLLCNSPVCYKHSSKTYHKEQNVNICNLRCYPLFTDEFINDIIGNPNDSRMPENYASENEKNDGTSETEDDEDTNYQDVEFERKKKRISDLIESYDRILLLLQYSSQYIHEISSSLKTNTIRSNQVDLGTSSVGLLSGFTGMAAVAVHIAAVSAVTTATTAAMLTPVGPPLLIASILFGGTAAVTSSSSEAVHYYSKPNQLANKILALHKMLNSLLHVITILKETPKQTTIQRIECKGVIKDVNMDDAGSVCDDKDDKNVINEDANKKKTFSLRFSTYFQSKKKKCILDQLLEETDDEDDKEGMDEDDEPGEEEDVVAEKKEEQIGDDGDNTLEVDYDSNRTSKAIDKKSPVDTTERTSCTVGNKKEEKFPPLQENTRKTNSNMSRVTSNVIKATHIASIACGGVLSAATIILEAKQMTDTIEKMRKGDPCEKADVLLRIKEEIGKLPDTNMIAEECNTLLKEISEKSKKERSNKERNSKPTSFEVNKENTAPTPVEQ